MRIYIAGPMRGYTAFNFPAFDAAQQELEALGHSVISPAELDRAFGLDIATDADVTPAILRQCIRRDIEAIQICDLMMMLPKWQHSRGATAEKSVAEWMGIPVVAYTDFMINERRKKNAEKKGAERVRAGYVSTLEQLSLPETFDRV